MTNNYKHVHDNIVFYCGRTDKSLHTQTHMGGIHDMQAAAYLRNCVGDR